MAQTVTEETIKKAVNELVGRCGIAGAAEKLDYSPAYLLDFIRGYYPISAKMARKVGFQQIKKVTISYRRLSK